MQLPDAASLSRIAVYYFQLLFLKLARAVSEARGEREEREESEPSEASEAAYQDVYDYEYVIRLALSQNTHNHNPLHATNHGRIRTLDKPTMP